MKRIIITIGTIWLLTAALAWPTFGQDPDARDLFTSYAAANPTKGRPGAKIRLELLRGTARPQFVPLDTAFRKGDKVKLHFEVNFAAYVSIYNLGTTGAVKRLYPQQGRFATARAATEYVVPAAATEWFEFDKTPGTERLNFVFSSSVPAQKKAAAPAPKPKAKPADQTETVIVEPGGRALNGDSPEETEANARDLNKVQLKDAYYALGTPQQMRQRVGIQIHLKHH